MEIWEKCAGIKNIKRIDLTAFRVQINEQSALRSLVDNAEEENILRDLLENSSTRSLLKLKFTSGNYFGSRFGHRDEPVIWYGSENRLTPFREKAFYNFVYLYDNENTASINGQEILSFSANIETDKGIRLDQNPFKRYENLISSPISYENSRPLGTAMRNASINAFTYLSARNFSNPREINTGVFSLEAFPKQSENINSYEFWKCFANKSHIEFHNQNPGSKEIITFNIKDFLIQGALPALIL